MDKYKNLKGTFVKIGIMRVLIVLSNFYITYLLIKILGKEQFGIFTAILSIFTWIFLLDLGLGKGMRNYVTIAVLKNDFDMVKRYISTAYVSLAAIILSLYIILIYFVNHFDIAALLNLKNLDNKYLFLILYILITSYFIKFYLGLIDQIFYALHRSEIVTFNIFNINLLYIFMLVLILLLSHSNFLILVTFSYSLSMVIVYFLTNLIFFFKNRKFMPSIGYFSLEKFKKIISSGYKILFIQIGFLLIIGLDRLIVLKFLTPLDVTKYDITYKIMSILLFPFSIVAQPLWSAYTDAYEKRDLEWIKKIYHKLYYMMMFMAFGVFFLTFFLDNIILLWLNTTIDIPFNTALLIGLLILLIMWSTMHSDFLFGVGKYNISLILVPLGIIFKFFVLFICYSLNCLTLNVVILSTIVGYSFFCIIVPFYIKISIIGRRKS